MFNREQLQLLSLDSLKSLARDFGLQVPPVADKPAVIDMILGMGKKEQAPSRGEGSGFIAQPPSDPSGFVSTHPEEASGFTSGGDVAGSGFIQQGDAPVAPKDQDGSGFIQSGEAGSGFLQNGGGEGSGFLAADGQKGSGFLDATGEHTEHLSPLDPSGQVLPTIPLSGEKSRAHGLGAGDVLTLNGQPYEITHILSQSSGEAVIYLVQNEADEVQVLKLYVAQQLSSREPNGTALERIQQIEHPDILPLLDFGVGAQKYQGQYCFEISALAKGGDLFKDAKFSEHFSPDYIREIVIPEVFQGIKVLHQNRIFHCDIKPQNIFFLDEARQDIVIGDYGSAKTFETGSQKEAQQFSTVIGTNTYLPPEQARGFISPKNDYYSFGVVLLHLLYPQQLGREDDLRRVDMGKFRRINERQFARKPIIDYDPRHQDLNQLIAGLTLYDDKDRWGAAEVEKWLKGTRVTVKYDATAGIKPIKLGYAVIYAPEDLLNVMEAHPTRWYGDLISDRHGYDALLSWVANRLDIPRKKRFDAMIQHYKADGSAFIKEAVARFFAPETPLKIGAEQYYFSDLPRLAEEIRRYFLDLDGVWKINDLKKVQFSLYQFELSLRLIAQDAPSEALALIKRVLGSMATQLDVAVPKDPIDLGAVLHRAISLDEAYETRSHGYLLRLFYLFDRERGFKDLDSDSVLTLEGLGHHFAQHPDQYDHPVLKLERAFFLNRLQRKDLAPLGLNAFLGAVFAEKAAVSLSLTGLKLGEDRSYTYQYTYHQSLDQYFTDQGFAPLQANQAPETHLVKVPGKWFLLPPAAWKKFQQRIEDEMAIPASTWEQPEMQASQRKVQLTAWGQWFGLGVKEWASAALWLLPWLGLTGFFLLTGEGRGTELFRQWIEATGLGAYAFSPEEDGDRVIGLYFYGIWSLFAYLSILIMRIWAGKRLEVIGKVRSGTPRWLSFQGLEGFGFLVVLALMPLMLWASNWLWEILGLVLLFGFGVILTMMPLEKNGRGLLMWRTVAGVICLLALVRLGLEIFSWVEFGIGWKKAFHGRGWLDIATMGLITGLFMVPPLFWQPISAHDTGRFLSKAAVLLLFIGLTFSAAGNRSGYHLPPLPAISVGVPSSNRLVPQAFYAQVNTSAANVRSAPNKNGDILGNVAQGVPFVVYRDLTENYWWVITKGELQGYMYKDLIQVGEQARTEDIEYNSYPASRKP